MISVIILTKNEEKNIKNCIKTISWADEIIVIDDYSKDKTVVYAQKLGAVVYKHHLINFAHQRNYGINKAHGEWILFVDADERVSRELRDEIISVVSSS